MSALRLVFGLHLHQPVGNFDHVFADHLRDVYRPVLEHLVAAGTLPVTLHVSGPLLEWLEQHDAGYLAWVGGLAADGKVELLLSGMYEPVLAALPRADRLEQIAWMREALRRIGAEARGLWLTERVWEPDLAGDLAAAGVEFALVDDRHFLVTGFTRDQLFTPWYTEHDGRRLGLLPIDEELRYLVPFRPPGESAAYLRGLHAAGRPMAVLADDGEKFGGWPGTREWVYDKGWLDSFLRTLRELQDEGTIVLAAPSAVLREVESGGMAYLPSASYSEMERWALPPAAAARLIALERDLGAERVAGPDGALVRGTHWRNFLARYAESNRMHKKMLELSALCRERGDPPGARRAVGRAQCNDAYWHGVFGGLYLPHLRAAVWRDLARAERLLRGGEALEWERRDVDADGVAEYRVHGADVAALVRPRGAVVTELLRLREGINLADTLTRRREAYHEPTPAGAVRGDGTERGLRVGALPPTDPEDRAIGVDRVLPHDLTLEDYAAADFTPLRSWAGDVFAVTVEAGADRVALHATARDLRKVITIHADGRLDIAWTWDPAAWPAGAWFAPELSLAHGCAPDTGSAAELWRFPIVTVAKSERGLDETVQGESFTPRWPVEVGQARVMLGQVPGRHPDA